MTAAPQLNTPFDFDEWSALAKSDPVTFEQKRLALIEEFLRELPPHDQKRLRGLQFRIDMERRRARTPMAACLKLSAMMWDSLLGSRGLKNALDSLLATAVSGSLPPALAAPPVHTADVLPFRKLPR